MNSHELCKKKAKELVAQMTLEEKASQLTYNSPAIKRLGIPAYNWWNEALHGVARAGVATVFPQAIGLAATFDEDFLEKIADCISTEGRAKFNMQQKYGDTDIYKGLTFWSPNVNIFRDPRWGRGHETYGEDPYLTGRLGVAFIKGLQGNDKKYIKAAACAKHFAVHSGPEAERHHFNAIVSKKDLFETYLPAFSECVKEANVEAVMCAYNRVNGEPCCGSKTLLKKILRDEWKFKGHVVSDCWAICDFHKHHMVTGSAPESAALALKYGCDLNCGNTYPSLLVAHKEGLIDEKMIDESVTRLMITRMKLGMFDDPSKVPYSSIPYEVCDSDEHRKFSLEVAKRTMVLLKNENNILPLDKSKIKSIAVIGPNANNREVLKGNYCGTASRYITVLEGIIDAVNESTRVYYSEGCHLYKKSVQGLGMANDRLAEAKMVCEMSDVVIACFGLDPGLEGEEGDQGNEFASGDKPDLNLPGIQEEILKEIYKCGKPVVLVLLSGSALSIPWEDEHIPAIVHGWYPGAQGGRAIAGILFGEYNPEGKLPVTFYRTTEELPDFTDYNMEGRTYRYMKNEALYPFGYGLSYTEFKLSDISVDTDVISPGGKVLCTARLKNIGDMPGAETVQIYVKVKREGAPNWQLKGLKKVFLNPGESKTVSIELGDSDFGLYDDKGNFVLYEGEYEVFIGTSQPDTRSIRLTGKKPYSKIMHAERTVILVSGTVNKM